MKEISFPYASASVTLLGFGRSGEAVLPLLLSAGARVSVRDQKPLSPAKKELLKTHGVSLFEGEHYLDSLSEDVIFRSPGIRPDLPPLRAAAARGARITGEYDEFAARSPATLLGITGSDGKTTTATLTSRILEEDTDRARRIFLGGNIGIPLLPRIGEMTEKDIAVAELSSFQLMTAPKPPARAVITNITENHLNWHTDMREYIAAKESILGCGTHAILNADCPLTAEMARGREQTTVFSSRMTDAALEKAFPGAHRIAAENGSITYDGRALLALADIRLPGRHNIENYMAAIGLAYPFLGDIGAIRRVAHAFTGVPHRLAYIATKRGVRYYNSSIDSTPTRTAAALSALGGRPILLCGGRSKGLSWEPLFRVAGGLSAVIAFGECRTEIEKALSPCGIPLFTVPTLRAAFDQAAAIARDGDCVLLSPAATSFDEFRDFEERGTVFSCLVQSIQN